MCESSAFICKSNNELEKVMENVVNIDPLGWKDLFNGFIRRAKDNRWDN